jgi:hypothetical protein
MGSTGSTMGSTAGASQVTGKVDKVDQTKNELSLKVKVDPSTQVMKNGKTATLSDIKEGDQVRASFSGSQVQRIDVMSATPGGEHPSGTGMGGSTPSGSTPPSGGSSGSTGTGSTPPSGGSSTPPSGGSSGGRGY